MRRMRISRWLSESFRRRSRRERAVVLGGGAVAVLALALVVGVLPLLDRWTAREAEIAAKAGQRARLAALVENESRIREALAELRASRASRSTRLLSGATQALAASELQLLLRRYADQSRVSLNRVEVAGDTSGAEPGLVPVPVRLSGAGDVSGLVDLLFYLQHGEKLLVIDEVRVTAPPPRRTGVQLLSWSVQLHGYHAPGSGS